MTLSTSRNLTYLGIAMIVGAIANIAIALFDGDPLTNVNWEVAIAAVVTGVGFVLGKGAASTGGTVNNAGTPVVDPAPPVPAPK